MSTANLLSAVGPALMLVLLVMLLRRRLYKRFPVFFVYCLSIVVLQPVRALTIGRPTYHFFFYWTIEACFLLIAFVTMLSVLRPLTQLEYVRHPWSRFLLLPLAALIIGAGLWAAFVKPINKTAAGHFASAIYIFVIGMSVAELLLFLVSFRVRNLAIQWTRYEFGILRGFGALAALKIVAYIALVLRVFHFQVSPQLENLFQGFPVGAFIASATVWLVAFWKPEPPRTAPPDMGSFSDALRLVLEQYEAQAEFVRRVAKHLGSRLEPVAS